MPEKKNAADEIFLRPMSPETYAGWVEVSRAEYAKDKEKEGLSTEDAKAVAEKSFRDLLPEGPATKGQYVNSVIEKSTGQVVGYFWWGVQKQGSREVAWVYNISIDQAYRGRGWGRAAMIAGEAEVKAKGFHRFGLHVFGYNTNARNLYRSLGFEETNVVMYKSV